MAFCRRGLNLSWSAFASNVAIRPYLLKLLPRLTEGHIYTVTFRLPINQTKLGLLAGPNPSPHCRISLGALLAQRSAHPLLKSACASPAHRASMCHDWLWAGAVQMQKWGSLIRRQQKRNCGNLFFLLFLWLSALTVCTRTCPRA